MRSALMLASTGALMGLSGVAIAPAYAQVTAYEYSGSVSGSATISDTLSDFIPLLPADTFAFEEVFSGSISVADIELVNQELTAGVTELADLLGLSAPTDILGAVIDLIDLPSVPIAFDFGGSVEVFSGDFSLATYDLSYDAADISLIASADGSFSASALSSCFTEVCSAAGQFSTSISALNIPLAFAEVAFEVTTTPKFMDDGGGLPPDRPIPGDGDPVSVPEPAAVIGLIGIGGWLVRNRRIYSRQSG
ncbi:MAG: PEP-CTERM sorting domain-containing protein [Cyanobacteria bacterium P01_H01_bin.119]